MILAFLFTIALADLIFSREVRFAPILLFYLAVKAQADYAAKKFLREGLKWAEPLWVPPMEAAGFTKAQPHTEFREPEALKIISLAEARERRRRQEEAKARSERRQEPQQEPKAAPNAAQKPAQEAKRPRKPCFTGAPHEVLGVGENAVTAQIVGAFRHWIKQYHPDHSKGPQANENARQLHAAKQTLLEKRKRMRAAS